MNVIDNLPNPISQADILFAQFLLDAIRVNRSRHTGLIVTRGKLSHAPAGDVPAETKFGA